MKSACARTDLPTAGLLQDLKRRGLLDSTLVLWGGEFGRLPIAQLPPDRNEANAGRDHNKNAFCGWMAGAGIKGGTTHGATDDYGFAAVEGRVGVPDWHATVLHLLGLHHDELFVDHNGLKEKLTSVFEARVVKEILRLTPGRPAPHWCQPSGDSGALFGPVPIHGSVLDCTRPSRRPPL